jgi:branched-chain amino acid transport system substrate-binding protein
VWWSPSHPFKSSLNGQSATQLASAYTAATKKQWTQPIGFIHSLFEVAVDVLKRTPALGDQKAMVKAIKETNLQTIVGPVKWNMENVPPFARANVTRTPLVGGQWRLKDGSKYDIVITDNQTATNIPTGGKMEAIA